MRYAIVVIALIGLLALFVWAGEVRPSAVFGGEVTAIYLGSFCGGPGALRIKREDGRVYAYDAVETVVATATVGSYGIFSMRREVIISVEWAD